jgi:4-amino-4-deoxy-L-arabinose transferase-like glycosyltransferase
MSTPRSRLHNPPAPVPLLNVSSRVRASNPSLQTPAADVTAQRACFALLAVALLYWLWIALAGRSISTDPAISVLAAQSILEHGYPLLPSGFIYDRAYVATYLLALSIRLFGLNDFSVSLPSLPLALGSLYLTYLIAQDVLGRPRIGVLAMAVLIALEVNSQYAASPRMYMSLQFFTTLAVYAGWKGYFKGIRVYRAITMLAILAAGLTHQQGGMLALAIPFAFVVIRWLERRELPTRGEWLQLAWLLLIGAFIAATIWVPLSQAMHPIAMIVYPGGLSGLNLRPRRWLAHANWLEHTVPLGIFLGLAVLALTVREIRSVRLGGSGGGAVYLVSVMATWVAGVLGYIRVEGSRFWMGIVPVYVLVLLLSASLLLRGPFGAPSRHRLLAWRALNVAWALIALVGYSLYYGPAGYPNTVRDGYGLPCRGEQTNCNAELGDAYRALGQQIAPEDVVISTNPFVANYYLGRVDGWLVQQRAPDGLAPLEASTDEYFGIPIIDRESEILELVADPRRVWVLMDYDTDIQPSLMELVTGGFTKRSESGALTVYVGEPTR